MLGWGSTRTNAPGQLHPPLPELGRSRGVTLHPQLPPRVARCCGDTPGTRGPHTGPGTHGDAVLLAGGIEALAQLSGRQLTFLLAAREVLLGLLAAANLLAQRGGLVADTAHQEAGELGCGAAAGP